MLVSQNLWESTSKSELVSIGTHHLFLSTSGKPRSHKTPVVIFFTGGGVPIAAHIRLQRLLSDFCRVYFYNPSGYDQSEFGPVEHTTATVAAEELTALLHAVKVAPPYILVGVSYGCMLAREFLHLHSSSAIAGMVLVEAATELMFELYPHIPDENLLAIADGVDWVGLTHLREESKLTDEEWDAAIEATERCAKAAEAADNRGSGKVLATRRQFQNQALGQRPLSVVRCNSVNDYRVMYEAGVKAGNGTKEQRERARSFIESADLYDDELRAGQLRLSGRNRYVHIPDCGHDVSIRRPEVIVEEVRWILGQLQVE